MKKGIIYSSIWIIIILAIYSFVGCITPIITTSPTASSTQQNPSITVVNNTGFTIYYLYVSEPTSTSWGQDRLRSDQVLSDGHSVSVQLPHPINRVNQYDIMLVDSDGDEYTKMKVTVRADSRIVFTMADIDYPVVTVVNNTGYTITGVYIFEPESEIGQNRISSNIRNGQSTTVQLSRFLGNATQYHVAAVDIDGDIYLKPNVNFRNRNSRRVVFVFNDIIID